MMFPHLQLHRSRDRIDVGIVVFIDSRLECSSADRIFGPQTIVQGYRVARWKGIEIKNSLRRR